MNSQLLGNPKKTKLKLDTKLLNFTNFSKKFKNSFVNLDDIQKGGSSQAYQLLESFLSERSKDYRIKMLAFNQNKAALGCRLILHLVLYQ